MSSLSSAMSRRPAGAALGATSTWATSAVTSAKPACRTGKVTTKVLPSPGADRTLIRPLCSATRWLTKARPRPVPPASAGFWGSCSKGRKMRA